LPMLRRMLQLEKKVSSKSGEGHTPMMPANTGVGLALTCSICCWLKSRLTRRSISISAYCKVFAASIMWPVSFGPRCTRTYVRTYKMPCIFGERVLSKLLRRHLFWYFSTTNYVQVCWIMSSEHHSFHEIAVRSICRRLFWSLGCRVSGLWEHMGIGKLSAGRECQYM
jgi:hypothetical protein